MRGHRGLRRLLLRWGLLGELLLDHLGHCSRDPVSLAEEGVGQRSVAAAPCAVSVRPVAGAAPAAIAVGTNEVWHVEEAIAGRRSTGVGVCLCVRYDREESTVELRGRKRQCDDDEGENRIAVI